MILHHYRHYVCNHIVQSKYIKLYVNIINVDAMFSWEVSLQTSWSISQLRNILASNQETMKHGALRNGVDRKRMKVLKRYAIYY